MQLPSLVNTRTGSISPLCDDKLMGIGQNQRASLDVPVPMVRGFPSRARLVRCSEGRQHSSPLPVLSLGK